MLVNLDYKKVVLIKKTEDNEEVSIEIKTLNTRDYNKVVNFFAENSITTNRENALSMLDTFSNNKIQDIAKDLLPKYCNNFLGVDIQKEGTVRPATIEDLYSISSFIILTSQIINKLIASSTIGASNAQEAIELKKQ